MNTFSHTTKVIAARDPHRFMGDDLLLFMRRVDDSPAGRRVSVPEPIIMREAKEQEFIQPMLVLRADEAQRLMDTLWECGVRPSSHTSVGQLEQVEKHLADLRAIAFHKLGITAAAAADFRGEQTR